MTENKKRVRDQLARDLESVSLRAGFPIKVRSTANGNYIAIYPGRRRVWLRPLALAKVLRALHRRSTSASHKESNT